MDEVIKLTREVALAECLEYLLDQMANVNFSFNPGKKNVEVFDDLLDNFSVAKVFSIIYN